MVPRLPDPAVGEEVVVEDNGLGQLPRGLLRGRCV